jgi:hypothetical protein
MSLAVSPGGRSPTNSSSIVFGTALVERLRREHVLDLRRCRSRTRARRRRRASTCGCRRRRSSSRLRDAELGPITWTMPSLPDPVACSSMPNSSQLARSASSCAFAISSVTGPRQRRHVVIHRRDRQIGPPHLPAGEPQPLECLRRGDLVDEVQVDVEQRRLTGSSRTTCRSQTFSNRLRAAIRPRAPRRRMRLRLPRS